MELDFAKINACRRAYRKWLKTISPHTYDYDNEVCCCFAHLLSNEAEKDGYRTYKVCALVSERNGRQKGVSVFLPKADGSGFAEVSWNYHMAFAVEAPVYKDSPQTELLVADPVLFGTDLVTLSQWKKTLACPDYAFLTARKGMSLQGSPRGYWLSGEEPADLDAHAKEQIAQVAEDVRKQKFLEDSARNNPALQKHLQYRRRQQYKPLVSMLGRKAEQHRKTILQTSRTVCSRN